MKAGGITSTSNTSLQIKSITGKAEDTLKQDEVPRNYTLHKFDSTSIHHICASY